MRKATHKGKCQICGRFQKLPNGKLAKHGYTVDPGGPLGDMFLAICPGSNQLPLEQSCDQIAAHIESLRKDISVMQSKVDCVHAGTAIGFTFYPSRHDFAEVVNENGELFYYEGATRFPLLLKENQSVIHACVEKSRLALQRSQTFIEMCNRLIGDLELITANWKPQELHPISSK